MSARSVLFCPNTDIFRLNAYAEPVLTLLSCPTSTDETCQPMVSIKIINILKQPTNIFITCIISTPQLRQRGWKDHFQVLLKYMEKISLPSQEVRSSSKVACQHFSEWSWLCTEAPTSRYIPLQKKKMWEFFTLPETALFGNHICFLCKYRK